MALERAPEFISHVNLFESEADPGTPAPDVVLGIDEAGRGPVLGPMVYACFYCPHDRQHLLETFGIDDSKKLTPEQRQNMFDTIHENQNLFGWRIHSISPEELSAKMLRRCALAFWRGRWKLKAAVKRLVENFLGLSR
eukprot:GHVT01076407.1.p1 GENE.GHVT01076407.1~~GHVT01076407.1.p1  ORF type:complete len:138 (+),score=22.22 GHVT01076407.1:675-1088(+)